MNILDCLIWNLFGKAVFVQHMTKHFMKSENITGALYRSTLIPTINLTSYMIYLSPSLVFRMQTGLRTHLTGITETNERCQLSYLENITTNIIEILKLNLMSDAFDTRN